MSDIDTEKLPIKVYTPQSAVRNPRILLGEMFGDLYAARELAWRLAIRDITARYRQSLLGILWAFILPIANTVTWVFLRASGIVAIQKTDIPYPVYVFTGTLLWAVFSESLNAPLNLSSHAKHLLAKLNFPREALFLSGIYQTLFNSSIKVGIAVVAMIALGVFPTWSLLLAPIGVLSLVLTGTAIGLLLTPFGMLYQDVNRGLPLILQYLMYLTPVVFPLPREGWVAVIYRANPLTPLIVTTRDWLTGGSPEFLGAFIGFTALMLGVFFIGWVAYRIAMPILIERMTA